MEIIFEILKVILPVIITGLFTFLITKYTYNKNRPLDKMEIAYNRVYYPLYIIIHNSNENLNDDVDLIIKKSENYFKKYNKYIDKSTKLIFRSLCKCNKIAKKKALYKKFKNNIFEKDVFLRRILGYLEPNFFQEYKYSSSSAKSLFRILWEVCFMYIALLFSGIIIDIFDGDINKISGILFLPFIILFLLIIVIIIEIIYAFVIYLYYKIRK